MIISGLQTSIFRIKQFQPFTIFTKYFISDVSQGSEYFSVSLEPIIHKYSKVIKLSNRFRGIKSHIIK